MQLLPESIALLNAAQNALRTHTASVVVTVISTRGSAPREAGTAMLVNQTSVAGTVGGGRLEHIAIELARAAMSDKMMGKDTTTVFPYEVEYPLGAALGQCCGGAMTLRYEWLNVNHLTQLQVALNGYKTLFLFGAGHVAQALVPLLAAVPLRIVWADSRDAINAQQAPFPTALPEQVSTVISDTLEAELNAAKAGDMALIMTHSHALDESLVQAALRLPQLAYIGLIGSATKRRLFEQRLAQRGYKASDLQRLSCPIGVATANTTHSKLPAVIAVQVAAQLTAYL